MRRSLKTRFSVRLRSEHRTSRATTSAPHYTAHRSPHLDLPLRYMLYLNRNEPSIQPQRCGVRCHAHAHAMLRSALRDSFLSPGPVSRRATSIFSPSLPPRLLAPHTIRYTALDLTTVSPESLAWFDCRVIRFVERATCWPWSRANSRSHRCFLSMRRTTSDESFGVETSTSAWSS